MKTSFRLIDPFISWGNHDYDWFNKEFKQNDFWGNPRMFNYPETGIISPSTLRYINVYEDLLKLFNDLSDFCDVLSCL